MRKFGLLQLVLCVLMLFGCASAVDDAPLEGGTESASLVLGDAALDADAATADCDAAAGSYEELSSILETQSINLDGELEAASTCRRVCACCRRGNRFCCSHCKFCSGPIGPYGVSTGELAR